ncbi:MAG TPA: aldo/keto reductase [Gemmatimonadales bacterium]|jgi:Predicted oxidoreductases (related to aryl-alcohol dehydrogenases)
MSGHTSSALVAAAAGSIALGSDLTVNRMGFGAMRLTGRGIWGPPADRQESIRVLRRALDLGVDFIDTADSYGPAVAEELIAEALHPYPAGLVIATKAGLERPGPDRWEPNGRPDYLRRQLESSLRRLRLERIDLWQLHRIDEKVPEDEQFGAMRRFQEEGLVRHLGLSEVSVPQIERARRVVPIVSVQNRYNLTDREWEAEVDYSEREGLAFLPWFPLAAGALDETGPLARVARRHEATPYQVALAWLLARSPAMLVIPGTSSVGHLEENVRAAELRLAPEDLEDLGAVSR